MKSFCWVWWGWRVVFWGGMAAMMLAMPGMSRAQTQMVVVCVEAGGGGAELAPGFLGLSYESSMVLPERGRYYFDPDDRALVNTFHTLGIKSLRIGANAVDDARIPVPREKDIDELFRFARAAGVKVIYSFRLRNGDPSDSARLAAWIAARDADALDCFAVGNEPAFYLPTFSSYYAHWKLHYDAILKAVPDAMFDGPSVVVRDAYALALAKAVFPGGHLAMASDHYYFLGSGREGEKNPAATRARFLSNRVDDVYKNDFASVGAVLAAQGVPYRIDELNNCYLGGARDASDTYAAALWALDCTHWWAAHHILGMNYHTGEVVGRDGSFGPPNYAAFLRSDDGIGFEMHPEAYALLAFTQAAHGSPLKVTVQTSPTLNFNAYAYRDGDGSIYVTLINKSYGDDAKPAPVTLSLTDAAAGGRWHRMDLAQRAGDIAAKSGITLGGGSVDTQGTWSGAWRKVDGEDSSSLTVAVAPASAVLLHFTPAK